MTVGRNLSRARSHIIFIIALLAAASYILWVESSRGEVSKGPSAGGWQVELGAFDTAAAAGRQWDLLRERAAHVRPLGITIVEAADGVRLRGRVENQETAEALCAASRAAGTTCRLLSPGS